MLSINNSLYTPLISAPTKYIPLLNKKPLKTLKFLTRPLGTYLDIHSIVVYKHYNYAVVPVYA